MVSPNGTPCIAGFGSSFILSRPDLWSDADDVGFGVGFTQLNTCRKPVRDPYPEASDVKAWVGAYLKDADARHGGRIAKFVVERLNDQQRAALGALMS